MLTKDEILRKMAGFDCPSYLHESCWQPIYDQCVAAINLAAENERLKAKLAKIKEKAWATGLHSDHDIYTNAITEIYQMCKDGGDT